MHALPFLFLSLVVVFWHFSPTYSEKSGPQCKDDYTVKPIAATAGEALRCVPYIVKGNKFRDEDFTWYRNDSNISSEEEERIHHHGPLLFFLNLSINDTGLYKARWNLSGKCHDVYIRVDVYPASRPLGRERLYTKIAVSDLNPQIPCPEPVNKLCKDTNGKLTWYKNFTHLQGEHKDNLVMYNANKADEAIYTCKCTWTHNHRVYNSTASRMFEKQAPYANHPPQIIAPTNSEHFADEGSSTRLICSAFGGRNAKDKCMVWWQMDEQFFHNKDGYTLNFTEHIEEPSKKSIFTSVLTINRVSARDFKAKFKCYVVNSQKSLNITLTLKPRESLKPLLVGGVCVLLLCVLAAVIVKFFAIDLALLFRRCFTLGSHQEDGKVYDAYVIYQAQEEDKALEETLCQFVSKVLPSVLEQKCGYRLFIHGRDDLPGEDRLVLLETHIRMSRRLMVILTLGSGPGSEVTDQHHASPQTSVDWQVGLHEALVQREMSVILIHLGDMVPQGYTHLPPGLQHLVRKNAPIRWQADSRGAIAWNSRFWKRVRYMMPATPAKNMPLLTVV
ncbi:interleukin-1 receptor type 1-like [Diretmus argenteus]